MADKTIDGVAYQTVAPAPSVHLLLTTRIAKVAGPALGALFEGGSGAMARSMTTFADNMDPEALTALIVDLCQLARVEVENAPGQFGALRYDLHFAGRHAAMPQVLAFVLEAEFKDFFSAFQELGSPAVKAG